MRTVEPFGVGWTVAMAGRSTPSSFLKMYIARAMAAPELPAETKLLTSPFFARSTATLMDVSFMLRITLDGESCMATTWGA